MNYKMEKKVLRDGFEIYFDIYKKVVKDLINQTDNFDIPISHLFSNIASFGFVHLWENFVFDLIKVEAEKDVMYDELKESLISMTKDFFQVWVNTNLDFPKGNTPEEVVDKIEAFRTQNIEEQIDKLLKDAKKGE